MLHCDWFLELCADYLIKSSRVPPFIFSISMNAKSFDSTIYKKITIIEMFKSVLYLCALKITEESLFLKIRTSKLMEKLFYFK